MLIGILRTDKIFTYYNSQTPSNYELINKFIL